MARKYASLIDRIIANSVLMDEYFYNGSSCWIWIGTKKLNRRGVYYGTISMRYKRGPRKGKVHHVLVHRLVLREVKGYRMTPGTVGMHLCNNTLCCNPEHLFSASQKVNMRQCVADGRHKTPWRKAA